ncbi:MAG: transposase [Patescibacteria group bacterium]
MISFDVGKRELVGLRVNKLAKVKEKIVLANVPEVIDGFLSEVKLKYPRLVVSCEATADYHYYLAKRSLELGLPFRLINPILTKQFIRTTIRKKKTDLTDALIIAKLTLQGEGTLLSLKSLDPLKSINRTAFKINRIYGMLLAICSRIERVFPEQEDVLAEVRKPLLLLQETVLALRSRVDRETNQDLKNLLMSIPGIGPTIAATLITEIGDIARFPSGKSLVAYAGLDPKVRQSGISIKRNTQLTKRGSPYLRKAAYIAAYIAKRYDPELKEYFEKKKKEGKRHKEATCATARKVLYRVYAVWKRGTPYLKRYPQEQILT